MQENSNKMVEAREMTQGSKNIAVWRDMLGKN